MKLLLTVVILPLICCKALSLEFLEKTTPYIPRSPKLPLLAMAKSMEVGHAKFASDSQHKNLFTSRQKDIAFGVKENAKKVLAVNGEH